MQPAQSSQPPLLPLAIVWVTILGALLSPILVPHPDYAIAAGALVFALSCPRAYKLAWESFWPVVLVALVVISTVYASVVTEKTHMLAARFCAGLLFGAALGRTSFGELRKISGHAKSLALAVFCVLAFAVENAFFDLDDPPLNPAILLLLFSGAVSLCIMTAPGRAARMVTAIAFTIASLLVLDKKTLIALFIAAAVAGEYLAPSAGLARQRIASLALTALVCAGLAAFGLWSLQWFSPTRYNDIVSPETSVSSSARLALFMMGVASVADHPALGLGPDGLNTPSTFGAYYDMQYLAALVDAGKTHYHAEVYEGDYTSGVHNTFLDICSSYGLIAAGIILWSLGRAFLAAFSRRDIHRVALLMTFIALGMSWQYTVFAYGSAFLGFCLVSPATSPDSAAGAARMARARVCPV